ncbi:MAG: galactose mutarotase [Acetatifactor muris]|nr:galactose mutarotase [Acetatifactor muris]MCM1528334.1 galactose mutarotase [Bacteroides sp.]
MAITVESKVFGKASGGEDILLYTLRNEKGMSASVMNLGAVLVELKVPDRNGEAKDVVLGFDSGERYYRNPSFFGAVIGPNANRIGGAAFTLDGEEYKLAVNDNANNLHSDYEQGYHMRIWEAEASESGVTFTIADADGSMGFPGNKKLQITYTLDEENGLTLRYHGSSDRRTILNPTNHSYFNLDGHDAGNIAGHTLWIGADAYTPVVAGAIPTGEIADVKGTPMDFTEEHTVGDRIDADMEQLKLTGGYDHNWVITGADGSLRHVATVKAPVSGRVMKVYTTLPGVQFYAGNFIEEQTGKGGAVYRARHGLCLETQYYPDTIHHDNFPSCVFGAGKDYDSVTVYRFE